MPVILIICLISNYFFIKEYGSLGAAYATFISFCSMFFLYTFKGAKYLKINYNSLKVSRIIALFFISYSFIGLIRIDDIWIGIFFKLLVILVMIMVTLFLRTYFYKDITLQVLNYFNNR